ncbi:MAG: hypothetical protein RLZZ91_711 [Bacteroidota bacterium]|jgi:hypothetical protein
MKTLRSLLVAAALTIGSSVMAQNIVSSNEVNLTLSTSTTREQLFQLRNEMIAQGLDFQYTPQFDANRTLIGISYSVRTTTGGLVVCQSNNNVNLTAAAAHIHLVKQNGNFVEQK